MRARLLLPVAFLAVGCQSPTSPSPSPSPSVSPLSHHVDTAHFAFRMSAGDTVNTAWQEAYHKWAVAALQVNVTRPITYNKYLSRVHMGDITGSYNTNAYANAEGQAFEVHTIWPADNHEVVHLYSSTFGRTVALFSEGFAVAFQINAPAGETVPKWSGTPLHDLASSLRQQGRLAPLSAIADTAGFRAIDPNVAYPESGSFVRFLIDTHGLEAIKRLYGVSRPSDSGQRIADVFLAVYGRSLADAEQAWWAMLDAPRQYRRDGVLIRAPATLWCRGTSAMVCACVLTRSLSVGARRGDDVSLPAGAGRRHCESVAHLEHLG